MYVYGRGIANSRVGTYLYLVLLMTL